MSKICKSCGQSVDDNTAYCPNCGSSVQEGLPSTNAGSVGNNPYQQDAQFGSTMAAGTAWGLGDDKKLVNKIAYGLLAILLGGFGVHKFYTGKTMWGIIYILLCWTGIPAILALVEGIIGFTTKGDGHGNIYA